MPDDRQIYLQSKASDVIHNDGMFDEGEPFYRLDMSTFIMQVLDVILRVIKVASRLRQEPSKFLRLEVRVG